MESFSFYQEITSCSSVTHCVTGYFAYHSQQLLLSRHNSIELYELVAPLKQICKMPLLGEIQSLAVLKHSNYENDLLLIACREAKLITLIYNSNCNSFEVLALHSFENEKDLKGISILADPDSRCLVGNVCGNKVFVIPTRIQDRVVDEVYPHALMGHEIYKPLFMIEVPIYARSMVLMKGYTEPMLAVLFSPKPLQYPLAVKFFSLNLKKKEAKEEKQMITLPDSACHTLISLHHPLNGILVLSSMIIYYIGENQQNQFTLQNFKLDNCACEFIDSNKLLILLSSGEFIMLGLNYTMKDNMEVLNDKIDAVITILPLDFPQLFSAYESKLKYCSPFLFVGSRIHDSFLFNLKQCMVEKEYSEMKEGVLVSSTYKRISFIIEKSDEIIGIAGAVNSTLFKRELSEGEPITEILVASGYGKNSFISKISLSLIPVKFQVIDEESMEGLKDIYGLYTINGKNFDNFIVISKSDSTEVLKIDEQIEDFTANTDFIQNIKTLSAGNLGKNMTYQCYIDGIRIMDNNCKLKRDVFKPSIWKISVIGIKVSILYLDGSIENYKFKKEQDVLLNKINDMSTSISTCKLLRTYILAVGKENGALDLYYMLTGTRVLTCLHATEGPALLTNEDTLNIPITDPCSKIEGLTSFEIPYITDLLVSTYKDLMIICMRLSTGQIFIYKSFETFKFTRIVTNLYLGPCEINHDQKSFFALKQGIIVSHTYRNFMVVPNTDRKTVHVHAYGQKNDNLVGCCSFNHPDCVSGFMLKKNDNLEICKFEETTEEVMDQELLMVRKRFQETPRHILSHESYIIVSFFTDSEVVQYRVKEFVYVPQSGLFEISEVKDFMENEVIMAMCLCKFSRKIKPPYDYLVIATGVIGSDETTSQGRLLLFSFNEGRLVFEKLHKAPGLKGCCSALACIHDYLLVGAGPEIKIFNFVDEEGMVYLEPVAFYYGYTMSTGLDVNGPRVLCTDTLNQMYLLEYEEASSCKNLNLKGQYFRNIYPLAVSFHENRQIVADNFKNIHIFLNHEDSDKIEKVGDIHSGLTVFSFCPWGNSLIMISFEGAISALFISEEGVYRKVNALLNSMLEALPNRAGLNQRGYRLSSTQERERQRKSVLDLSYVMNYCYLSLPIQNLIARNNGNVPLHVLQELSELNSLFN